MRSRGYTPGDWLATCYHCGRAQLASTMRKQWQGYWVCKDHWEQRHPQDFVKGSKDIQTVPWSQPMTETFIGVCTFNGLSAIPSEAMPGCSIPGRDMIDPNAEPVAIPNACDIYDIQGVPSWGVPGCAIPGFDPFVS